jgi:hypothetical protein
MPRSDGATGFLEISASNVADCGIYCIKNSRSPGCQAKVDWVRSKVNQHLRMQIALDTHGKQAGFIEYTPSEFAWRPVQATNYYFIHCIAVFGKAAKEKKIASRLLVQCEQEAKAHRKAGICVMTSDGPWMANKELFLKNGYTMVDRLGRFELMVKQLENDRPLPQLVDWTKQLSKYTGWNLVYADQCPWHAKSVTDLQDAAKKHGIDLTVKKLTTPKQAQHAPSGYGTFSLIYDGQLLADHYLSRRRFESILKQR